MASTYGRGGVPRKAQKFIVKKIGRFRATEVDFLHMFFWMLMMVLVLWSLGVGAESRIDLFEDLFLVDFWPIVWVGGILFHSEKCMTLLLKQDFFWANLFFPTPLLGKRTSLLTSSYAKGISGFKPPPWCFFLF